MKQVRILLAAVALSGTAAVSAAGVPTVALVSPATGVPIIGPVTIAFEIRGVPAVQVEEAAVLLDGKKLATLTRPPWSTVVDAGDDLRSRTIEIRVTLLGGQLISTRVQSQKPQATEVEVRLVNLGVTVLDPKGKPAMDLRRDEFQVQDAGKPVEIERWEAGPAPLAVAFALDSSMSMEGDPVQEAKRAVRSFIEKLTPRDRMMVVSFSDDVHELVPLTDDRESTLAAVDKLVAAGGTALYDAIFSTAHRMRAVPPDYRRVVVLLSDGRDEAASGMEPGSFHTLDEAIHETHQADAAVFSIGVGPELGRTDFSGRLTTSQVLTQIAQSTGGQYHEIGGWRRLGPAFRNVLEELRQQYWMAYRAPAPRPGEKWRDIVVKVTRPGYVARTRQGYFVD